MPPKTDRSRPITWRDVVPVVAFAAALLLTFWTRQYSDLPPNSLPAHWNNPSSCSQLSALDEPFAYGSTLRRYLMSLVEIVSREKRSIT